MNKYERLKIELASAGTGKMKAFGNSMLPILKSGSLLTFARAVDYDIGDIVFCKVKGRYIDAHKIIKSEAGKGFLIANNHGGSGKDKRNLVTITDGTNHPGMRRVEDAITAHVRAGNTVDVIVKPIYKGNNLIPESVHIFAMDQNHNIIANHNIPNGAFQHHKSGCC